MDDDNKKNNADRPKRQGPRGGKPDGKPRGAPKGRPAFVGKGDRPPRGDKPARPFSKGPRPKRSEGADARRSDDRPRSFGDRPSFGKKPFGDKRPFAGPRADPGSRPFLKGPRPERSEGGESRAEGRPRPAGDRPFNKKPFGEKRPFSGPRPERAAEGDRKPYQRPDGERSSTRPPSDAGARTGGDRPVRKEGRPEFKRDSDRPRFDKDRPRSFSPKPFDGPKREGGDRPRPRPDATESEPGERIAKRLARAGIASRREAEDLVSAGRIKVNGKTLSSPAFNVSVDDRIELDGSEIPAIERTRLFLFHKPAGVVTTNHDPEGRKTVFDTLPKGLPRLMTVGRLDINTEGLLLLTNDGGLSRILELPTTGWLRRYRVRVHGAVDEKALAGLKDGVAAGGVFYGAIEASLERTQGTNAWLTVGLREGKNREIKNVMTLLGLEVTRLIRVSFGPFQLGELPEGQVQELKGKLLRDQLGERLIEESGANFEAPVTRPFSNKAEQRNPREDEAGERPARAPKPEIGEGGLIKRRQYRESRRDDALGKLSTRPERPAGKFGGRGDKPSFGPKPSFGAKPFGGPRGKPEREQKPIEPPGQRKANIWMAPGARPQGKKPEGETGSARSSGRDKPRGDRPRGPRKD